MYKCKYAGDVNDDYCKSCSGVELMFEGIKKSATDCAGYEPSAEKVETDLPWDEKKELVEEVEVKKEDLVVEKVKEEPNEPKWEIKEEEPEKKIEFKFSSPKTIKVMSGVTKQINDVYYKFTFEQENELVDGITAEQLEEEKEKLWAVANIEVDNQLQEVLNS